MKTIEPEKTLSRLGRDIFRLSTSLVGLHILSIASHGAAMTQMYFDTGPYVMAHQGGSLLSGGSSIVDHDGAVVQIGYYRDVGAGTPEWVPLTGEGSANTAFAHSTIGDSFLFTAGRGTFFDEFLFTAGNPATGQNFPMDGTPLAVRFFNGLSIAHSASFQELSNLMWLWKTPQESSVPVVSMSLEDAGSKMLFNRDLPANGVIILDQPLLLPEPSSSALLGVTLVALIARRRTRK